jgi:ankyrin repeat protein
MTQLAIDLIKRGVRVDAQNNQGMTPLHHAAAQGHADILIELLRRGAPVNAQSTGGWTPLHGAVAAGDLRCAELLIERRAHVNGPGRPPERTVVRGYSWGTPTQTPLQIALFLEDEPIAQRLIEVGADVNATGTDRQPPLYLAYRRGKHATFQHLLDNGADPNTTAPNGIPLIYVAAANQRRETVDALLQHGARADDALIRTLLEKGTTPLHTAAQQGDLNRANELLAHGADRNVPDRRGLCPIHHAQAQRHLDLVRLLLPGTHTPIVTDLLIKEIDNRDRTLVPLLLAHGADANATNPRRPGSLLYWLAYDLETMELLLTHGADVNATAGSADIPLAVAVQVKAKDAVALLLAHGADCNIATSVRYPHRGRAPLGIALSNGSFAIARLLVEAGADVNARSRWDDLAPLHMALPDRALFELILAHGAPIDARSRHGQTPLHLAADQGQTDNVQYLLDKGAAIDAQDDDGNTPLHLAARKGHRATCILLLDRQADITIRSKRARLPLDYAIAAELDDLIPHLTPSAP